MKKLVVLLFVVMTCVMLVACGNSEASADGVVPSGSIAEEYEVEPTREYTEQEANEDIMNYVDQRIATLMKSDAYKNADVKNRSEKMLAVLHSLESSGYIIEGSIDYVEAEGVIRFTYSTDVSGDVVIKN